LPEAPNHGRADGELAHLPLGQMRNTSPGDFSTAYHAARTNRFGRDDLGDRLALVHGLISHEPGNDLFIGSHVRCHYVDVRSTKGHPTWRHHREVDQRAFKRSHLADKATGSSIRLLVIRFVPRDWKGLDWLVFDPLIKCGRQSLRFFCVGLFLSFLGYFLLTISSSTFHSDQRGRTRDSMRICLLWRMAERSRRTRETTASPEPSRAEALL
jgi:OpgC protein